MTDICSDCAVIAEQNLHLSSVPTGSFSPMFLWQLGWWIIEFWTLFIWQDDLWGSPYCKKDTDKRDLCGRVGTWTGMMVTGKTLCSVTNPDLCCNVKVVVFDCADKLTRLYSMSVYCLRVQAGDNVSRFTFGWISIAQELTVIVKIFHNMWFSHSVVRWFQVKHCREYTVVW